MKTFFEFTLYTKTTGEFKTSVNKNFIVRVDKNNQVENVVDVTLVNPHPAFSVKGNYDDIMRQLNSN